MRNEKGSFESFAAQPGTFRQQVRIAALQVAGLSSDELAQALGYEVEPFSGVPAGEAEVRYLPLEDADPTVRVFDVAVRRRKQGGGSAGLLDRLLWPVRILAGLVLLATVMDGLYLWRLRQTLRREEAERLPLQQQLNRLQAEAQSIRAETAALRQKREETLRAQTEATRLRRAQTDLLETLAEACGERAVVTSLVAGDEPGTTKVTAVGLSAEAAAGVMQDLGDLLSAKGWRLRAGTIRASATGATVLFDFTMTFER